MLCSVSSGSGILTSSHIFVENEKAQSCDVIE